MDRFAMRLEMGYLPVDSEVAMLTDQQERHPLTTIGACATVAEVVAWRRRLATVRIGEAVKRYVVELVGATRVASGVKLGASPRASLALMKCGQALAVFDGQEYVLPDYIRELAIPVIAHRLVLDPQAQFSGRTGETVVREILERLPVPV